MAYKINSDFWEAVPPPWRYVRCRKAQSHTLWAFLTLYYYPFGIDGRPPTPQPKKERNTKKKNPTPLQIELPIIIPFFFLLGGSAKVALYEKSCRQNFGRATLPT